MKIAPFRLDGTMGAVSDTGIAVLSLVFMVGGYLLIAGLFYVIVYRPSRLDRETRRAAEQSDEGHDRDDPE